MPSIEDLAIRFRPNLVVGLALSENSVAIDNPFVEDDWLSVDINGIKLQVNRMT